MRGARCETSSTPSVWCQPGSASRSRSHRLAVVSVFNGVGGQGHEDVLEGGALGREFVKGDAMSERRLPDLVARQSADVKAAVVHGLDHDIQCHQRFE